MSSSSADAKKSPSKDEVPLLLRYGAQGFAIYSGIVAFVFGVWNCFGVITIAIPCVASGIFSILMGMMLIANETPIYGMYQRSNGGLEFNRNKAIGYSIASVPAFLMCPGMASLIASVSVFFTGILYAIISCLEHKHQKPQKPQQPLKPYQSMPASYVYKAPADEVTVIVNPVELVPTTAPAENQKMEEETNNAKPSNEHAEPIYPSLNI